MLNGGSGSKSIILSSGSGSATISSVPAGSGSLEIFGTSDGTNISPISQSITVEKGKVKRITLKVQGGGGGSSGEEDVIIIPETGPSTPTPNPNPPPNPTAWDGKSFQGNAKWSIEAIP